MKTTIFRRILLAILLPLVFVFTLVIITISNIISANGIIAAQQSTKSEAEQIARQISGKLASMKGFMELASAAMAEVDYSTPEARPAVEQLLRRLLNADKSFFSTWFVLEPEVFPRKGHVYQTIYRDENGAIRELHDITPEALTNKDASPWYNIALFTGELYMEITELYDYGMGNGSRFATTITAPILLDDRAIGAAGIDINYKDMFVATENASGPVWQKVLVSGRGVIVFSSEDKSLEGRSLFDFPFGREDALRTALAKKMVFLEELRSPFTEEESLICLYPVFTDTQGQSLYLYLATPTKDLYAVVHTSLELIISTSILGLILLGFSVFIATRNIVRPIKLLTVDFNRVSNEQQAPSAADPVNSPRQSNVEELDILQSALWKMISHMRQNHELRLKATEEQVEKEKILVASKAKNQFFANMSHEIRTPMNAILGISEILLHSDSLTGQQRKYLSDIKVSSEALLTIINDILDLSKMESGKLSLVEADFDFHEFLENIRTMTEYLAAPAGLECIFAIGGNLPRYLHGDSVRLRQVLLNILSNACKFTAKGSVRFSALAKGGMLRFTVTDTGPGMTPEDILAMFEPFRRLDAAEKRNIQGTGLGMSISKSLAEMMGGSITVQSEPGRGSTFTVIIPETAGEGPGELEDEDQDATAYAEGIRVLIVDDNEINLRVAEGLLGDLFGFSCDLAQSGPEALERIASNDYTLIFMDHMMPEMDGLETTRRIRAMGGAHAATPIIALTANAVKGARESMLEAGIDDYLTKPIEIAEFTAVLKKWIPNGLKRPAAQG